MGTQRISGIAFLWLMASSLLVACQADPTGPLESAIEDGRRLYLTVYPEMTELKPGGTAQLKAVLMRGGEQLDPPAWELVWRSTDPDVLRVSEDARIEAISLGEAWIQLTFADLQAEAWVEVTNRLHPPLPPDPYVQGHLNGTGRF